MREEEVKKLIGEDKWGDFLDFMSGQAMSMYEDGATNFYECDVDAFIKDPTVIHD